jgi:hypothetical protein
MMRRSEGSKNMRGKPQERDMGRSLSVQNAGSAFIAQCGDLGVHGVIMKPTPLGLSLSNRLKKGMTVRLAGHFSPTNFERHEGTDILKPFSGIMIVPHGGVICAQS